MSVWIVADWERRAEFDDERMARAFIEASQSFEKGSLTLWEDTGKGITLRGVFEPLEGDIATLRVDEAIAGFEPEYWETTYATSPDNEENE